MIIHFIFIFFRSYLATITSENELICIRQAILPNQSNYWIGGIASKFPIDDSLGFTWYTGESWEFSNWNEPRQLPEPCLSVGNQSLWQDKSCSISQSFLLEYGNIPDKFYEFVCHNHTYKLYLHSPKTWLDAQKISNEQG